MTDDLKVTLGRELRREYEEGELIRLPQSGAVVRVRGVEPDMLLGMDEIPEILTPIIVSLMDTGEWKDDGPTTPETLKRWRALVNAMVEFAMVEPHIVRKPAGKLADNEILIEHLAWRDRVHIVTYLHRPVDALAGFRGEQAVDVESVDAAEGDSPGSEPDYEPGTVGAENVSD